MLHQQYMQSLYAAAADGLVRSTATLLQPLRSLAGLQAGASGSDSGGGAGSGDGSTEALPLQAADTASDHGPAAAGSVAAAADNAQLQLPDAAESPAAEAPMTQVSRGGAWTQGDERFSEKVLSGNCHLLIVKERDAADEASVSKSGDRVIDH